DREAVEQAALQHRKQDLAIMRARADGLDANDPYVVELIARERHGFQAPGEIKPPPMPADTD
ncbi:MAG: hypothetical protein ACOCXJ_03915, partial [Planctomycetota bacterium]